MLILYNHVHILVPFSFHNGNVDIFNYKYNYSTYAKCSFKIMFLKLKSFNINDKM